jgi:very-short-patch-repair endonuclease
MPSDQSGGAPSPSSAAAEAAQLKEQERRLLERAFSAWRGRLLDLTARNRALNYRPTKVSTLTIVDEKPAEVYRRLVSEEKPLSFSAVLPSRDQEQATLPRGAVQAELSIASANAEDGLSDVAAPAFAPYESAALSDRHRDTVLQCHATPESLDLSLRRIAEQQRTSIEEQGVNTVFLALGFLHYRESSSSDQTSRAPLVLVPVTLERASAKAGYRLLLAEDEPMVNPSLVEYLRRVHQFDSFPSLPEPGDDDASVDLVPFLAAVADRVKHLENWRVTDEIVLAPFSFQKLVIYKDIEQNEATFATHPLVRRVVLKEGEPAHGLPDDIRTLDLDGQYPPEKTNHVVDADSSQLRAIAAVAAGHDLVIHGPPGTGKSQTITNLIADALGAGKRVLFVSEKMAALEVVHRRLVEARLGEFCLELHSTKARKSDVIESLRTALDRSGDPAKGTVKSLAELERTRGHLNAYAREVHAKRTALGCSVFDAVGQYEAAYDAPRFAYPGDPRTVTPGQFADLTDRTRQVEAQGAVVAPVKENGWRDSKITAFSETIGDSIGKAVALASQLGAAFLDLARRLHEEFGLREATTPADVPALVDLAEHLAASPGLPAGVLRDGRWSSPPPEAIELIREGRLASAQGERLASRYQRDLIESVSEDDLRYVNQKLGSGFAFLAIFAPRYRDVRRRLKAMRLNQGKLALAEQVADLQGVPAWKRACEALASHAHATEWFGSAWRSVASDWDDLEKRLAWLARFHALAARHGAIGDAGLELAERGARSNALPEELATTSRRFTDALAEVRQLLAWPQEYLAKESVASVCSRLAELARDLGRGTAWAAFVRALNGLAQQPAASIAEAAFRGEIGPDQVGRAFGRALFTAWLDAVLPTVPALSDFTIEVHDDRRRQFQKLDSQLIIEKRGEVVSRLRETGQRRFASSSAAHRTFLTKELAKQKRHRPLRVLLREAREAVTALKPCFLMSPLSVSQFLVPTSDFDLVVFDEASQLPTEDAVAAISRGKKLVVVGDPKQLPPTNFFAIQAGAAMSPVDDDGAPVLEETESVLEEFQGVGLHQAHLEWHYRSAHESLIQFSNERFYGNRLVVFPSAATDSPDRGVRFEFVDGGRYEGAGLNSMEARRIAGAVIEHFRTTPDLTLGVGTFSQRQQMAVWDELERARREDPSLEEYFDRARAEPFFVKNLENIQGDERDVIFLSVTYGKQADGKLRYNFGPLNRENGWRRLNVLVSRARKQMRVFSSLRASDINPSSVATQGPALLADFLRFAETGKLMSTSTGAAADAESPFEHEVGEALADMGYLVDRQVGVGAYRIDIGVRHRDRPGVYLAGIECDGAAYHAAPCARDRDRLRQYVLEQRGWVIVRVWSTDWFRDRARTIDRLKRTLDDLAEQLNEPDVDVVQAAELAAEEGELLATPEPGRVNGVSAPPSFVVPDLPAYKKASAASQYRTSLAEANPSQVSREAARVIATEGPIHHDELVARLIEFWNHERRGARLVSAAEQGIQGALRSGAVSRKDDFLYSNAAPIQPRNRAGLNQGAEWVALEELAETARLILDGAGMLKEEDLVTAVREALGLRRSQDGMPRIRKAIQQLIASGAVVYGVAGLRIRRST